MNSVYLLLGSNLGDSKSLLDTASAFIFKKIGKMIKESSFYESPPWGFSHENSFLNKVLLIETEYDAFKVLDECQLIEQQMGRVRTNTSEYQAREIDVDVLFYNEDIIENETLTVPHPRIEERRFTLLPMCEVAKDFVHPKLKLSMVEILNHCEDYSNVVKL